jgi:hypothetical protein
MAARDMARTSACTGAVGPQPAMVYAACPVTAAVLAPPTHPRPPCRPQLTVVIVVLAGQLLRAQLEGGHHFACQVLAVAVAVAVQADLCNERVVGHHHGAGPEQCLEVVRQLRAACGWQGGRTVRGRACVRGRLWGVRCVCGMSSTAGRTGADVERRVLAALRLMHSGGQAP